MGDCEPQEEDAQSCGTCRVEIRVCDDQCQWGNWGSCLSQGQCTPPDTDSEACGRCGTRSRSCTVDCLWDDWGACTGEGSCTPDDTDSEACGQCLVQGNCGVGECQAGSRSRTCDATCQWEPWGACSGNVDPGFDTCGDGLDQDCDGYDASDPDNYEPNDSCFMAYYLGEEPDNQTVYATIDTPDDDNDYYYFTGNDSTLDPTERIQITLEDIPAGADFDLCLYQGYDNCVASNPLVCSTNIGTTDESIDWGESFGGDDDGDYYVRVIRYYGNSCFSGYWLTVHGLR
jgi:hypothetical protein